jgi:2-polyprenyl-6-methoxyphenol hydroxylase-like FAD-dependent oxidoreductase
LRSGISEVRRCPAERIDSACFGAIQKVVANRLTQSRLVDYCGLGRGSIALISARAVVVGAGIAGLATARALADFFEEIIVLERDELPTGAHSRRGVPQDQHLHTLLAGGQYALSDLFPDFLNRLLLGGAITLKQALDLRVERPRHDPFPRRDLGFHTHSMTRPTLEHALRECVVGLNRVSIREGCTALGVHVADGIHRVDGVSFRGAGAVERLNADLVVDASGRGELTLAALRSLGNPLPEVSSVEVDFAYSSALFEIPGDAPDDWKGVLTFPDVPAQSRGALMVPVEGNRWLLSLGGRTGEHPPADDQGFLNFARSLRTTTVYDAIRGAKRVGNTTRYRFRESRRLHFERLQSFPSGLIVLGDAICRFNPVYGQGVSVAAQEARCLKDVLMERQPLPNPLEGLAQEFFERIAPILDTPWMMAAIPDFAFPGTRGTAPDNVAFLVQFAFALWEVAAEDAAIHKLAIEVGHLLRPRSALQEDPSLVGRVMEVAAALPLH